MPSQLRDRLNPIYDETIAATVMAGQATWQGRFGNAISQVRRIVIHMTAGWPRRQSAELFEQRFTRDCPTPGNCSCGPSGKCGIGTQFYISNDGTVARLIDLPRMTFHAPHVNSSSIGVETSNRLDNGSPPNDNWIQASTINEDIPGAKLWITSGNFSAHNEVCACWWTTDSFAGPSRDRPRAGFMLFGEHQYRA